MKKTEISVIMPAYNCSKTIHQSVESVENQSYYNYIKEIIIVDDGSTDNTKQIIENLKERNSKIILICQSNQGAAVARNIGIKFSHGNYIAFIDSDDCWYPHKLEKQITVIINNPHIRFIGSDYSSHKNKSGNCFLPFKRYKSIYNMNIYELCFKNYPVTPSVIIEKALMDEIGLFNEEMRYGEDINYFQKFCVKFNNYYIYPEPLVFIGMQKTKTNTGLSSNFKQMHQSNYINLRELYEKKYINFFTYYIFVLLYKFKYFFRLIKKLS